MIVVTLAVTETISWGILYYTFAVVLPAMEQELHWSRVAMTGAFSVALLASRIAAGRALAGPPRAAPAHDGWLMYSRRDISVPAALRDQTFCWPTAGFTLTTWRRSPS